MYVYYQGSDGSIKTLGDNELAHFNHNHDALGRFAKSGLGKVTKYERKAQKAQIKAGKYQGKSAKYLAKSAKREMKLSKTGLWRSPELSRKPVKWSSKGYKYQKKAAKWSKKQVKYQNKAQKWANKINSKVGDKPLTDIPLSELSSKQIYAGRKYAVRFVD